MEESDYLTSNDLREIHVRHKGHHSSVRATSTPLGMRVRRRMVPYPNGRCATLREEARLRYLAATSQGEIDLVTQGADKHMDAPFSCLE